MANKYVYNPFTDNFDLVPEITQGDKGDKGDNGIDGLPGAPGIKGDAGEQGLQGIPGEKGDTGNVGAQGIQGEQGLPGIDGIDGENGATGLPGAKGDTGEQGIQGEPGLPGGGYLSKCRVYFDGNFTFPMFTITKIPFNYINYDIDNEWDSVNYQFIIKTTGYYLITAQAQLANYKSLVGLYLMKNNTSVLVLNKLISTYAWMGIAQTIEYLIAGDIIDVRIIPLGASNGVMYGGDSNTFFAIHRLS